MSNQLFLPKNRHTKKKRNTTKAMAAAAFACCLSSSFTVPGVRSFSVQGLIRSNGRAIGASFPATTATNSRASAAAVASHDRKYGSQVNGKTVGSGSFWRTAPSTSLRVVSTSTTEEDDGSTENVRPYDLANRAAGLGNYVPKEFESEIYQWWESSGCFQPDAKQPKEESDANGKKPYVLPMPPPNVTGRLHMGHAIFVALQDALARFHRMRGRPVLWLPGTKILHYRIN